MNRTKLGAALLLMILAAGILSGREIGARNTGLARQLELASREAAAGNLEEAVRRTEKIRASWEDGWRFCAAVTDHEPLEQIDEGFDRLQMYGMLGDSASFAVVCMELAGRVESIADAHGAQWWSIL